MSPLTILNCFILTHTHSAGACGIVRTIVLARLDVMDYTINFVPYFAWAGAEISVSMICIGIPTLRPLYLKARDITSAYGRHGHSRTSELPRFAIYEPKTPHSPRSPRTTLSPSHSRSDSALSKPASTYTKASSRNSANELGVIQENGNRVIWVENEVRVQRENLNWPLRS